MIVMIFRRPRYGFQVFTALILCFISPLFSFSGPNNSLFLVFFVVIFGVPSVINFVNFMDGLDGLVAGCMSFSIAALSISLDAPWSLWSLFGSLLGFLFLNWSPAKIL